MRQVTGCGGDRDSYLWRVRKQPLRQRSVSKSGDFGWVRQGSGGLHQLLHQQGLATRPATVTDWTDQPATH